MEMKASHRREIFLLALLMILFALLFFIALINIRRGVAVFGIGLSYRTENYLIMVLSVLSVVRLFWAIMKH
jgi:hypothetical protein